MTSRLKKNKSKSSLDTKYVDNFLKNVESKLYDFNRSFLLPYKEKLNKKDKTVISDIAKDLKSPALVIKNALDELWNHHWIIGQKDVLNSETKKKIKSNFSSANNFVTFARNSIDPNQVESYVIEKELLQRFSRRIAESQKKLNKSNISPVNKEKELNKLRSISGDLQQYLGVLTKNTTDTRNKQFASIAVRVRDLQESIRVIELDQNNTGVSTGGIDILNSSEFGTIYQDKRTLLLANSLNEDYKQNVINKIQNYFTNTDGVRPNTREQTLFDSLVTRQDTATQRKYQGILKDSDKLSNEDRLAKRAIDKFIATITNGNTLNDKQLKSFATRDKAEVDKAIRDMTFVTKNSPLYSGLSKQLVSQVNAYTKDPNIKNYKDNIQPLLKEVRDRQVKNTLVGSTYKPGAYDPDADKYKPIEEIENAASNIFGLRRIKRIAETEISLAYNLGRLKKLEELGYTKVRITNETENRINRDISLVKIGSLAKTYRLSDSEQYLPLLCDHCLSRNGEVLDIGNIYGGAGVKVNTKFNERFSEVPPFHVSCWCYFVGVDEDKDDISLVGELAETLKNSIVADSLARKDQQSSGAAFYDDPFIKKLVIGGIGLLGVGTAYYAYNKLIRNRVQVPLLSSSKRVLTTPPSTIAGELAETNQQAALKGFIDSLDISAMVDVAEAVSKLPLSPVIRNVADDVVSSVDNLLSNEVFPTTNATSSTVNNLIADNPEYLGVLSNLLAAKTSYEAIRKQILDNQLNGQNLDEVYQQYINSKQDYESQLRRYLQATKDKKSTISDLNAKLNVSAREILLANRQNLPEGTSLEQALDNLKSRKILDSSNIQLKNIERNLNKELNNLDNIQSKESKFIDSRLGGRDTRVRAEQLKSFNTQLPNLTKTSNNLDSMVNNINKIKQDLNNTQTNVDTIRSISKRRLDTSSVTDRALLIDTQKTYMRQILSEKEKVLNQLKSLNNTENLENFSKLYRSEISNKVKTNYQYSKGVWSNADISKLDKTYREVSNVLTLKKSYESYLSELDDMLDKMNNFERTIDSNIQFNKNSEPLYFKLKNIPKLGRMIFNLKSH